MLQIKKPPNQVSYTMEGDHIVASLLVEIEDDKSLGVVVVGKTITVKVHDSRPKKVQIARLQTRLKESRALFLKDYKKESKFAVTFAEVQQSLENDV